MPLRREASHERCEEILIERIAFAVDSLLIAISRLERARCSAGSVSSPEAFASSTPQA